MWGEMGRGREGGGLLIWERAKTKWSDARGQGGGVGGVTGLPGCDLIRQNLH